MVVRLRNHSTYDSESYKSLSVTTMRYSCSATASRVGGWGAPSGEAAENFAGSQIFRMMRMVSTAGDVVMLTERGVVFMDGWILHSMLSNPFSVIATKYWLAASVRLP